MSADPDHYVLCWLASCDADGQPDVSPKDIFLRASEDEIFIAELASPQSLANILANPRVCVSLIDVFRQRGQKLEGLASVHPPDAPELATVLRRLNRLTGGAFTIRHIIRVRVARLSPILSPARRFHPELSEAALEARARTTYRVRRLAD